MEESEVFPNLDVNTIDKLLPEKVIKLGETVGHVSVLKLGNKFHCYEEVVISDAHSPSLFWVQLRNRLNKFEKFNKELNEFYSKKEDNEKYRIPAVAIKMGLNVACKFNNKWHRGIIKGTLPDGHSYIFFYDYGTVDNYYPNELYFLHRRFAYLPAQAILCSLNNVKPINKEWKRKIVDKFLLKASRPLCAEIVTKNVEENSLSVILIDTQGEEDININDWMREKEFAIKGNLPSNSDRNFSFSHFKQCLTKFGHSPSIIYNMNFDLEAPAINSPTNVYNSLPIETIETPLKENVSISENQVPIDSEESYEATYKKNQIKGQTYVKTIMTSSLLPRACPAPNRNRFKTNFEPISKKNIFSEKKTVIKSLNDDSDRFEFIKYSDICKERNTKSSHEIDSKESSASNCDDLKFDQFSDVSEGQTEKPSLEISSNEINEISSNETNEINEISSNETNEINEISSNEINETNEINEISSNEMNEIHEISSNENSSISNCDLPQFLQRTMKLLDKRDEKKTQENLRRTLDFMDKEDSPEREEIMKILNL